MDILLQGAVIKDGPVLMKYQLAKFVPLSQSESQRPNMAPHKVLHIKSAYLFSQPARYSGERMLDRVYKETCIHCIPYASIFAHSIQTAKRQVLVEDIHSKLKQLQCFAFLFAQVVACLHSCILQYILPPLPANSSI